ncbi:glutathione S-transferase [Pelagibaculum spongiae]|uniref:Glutathione S-transferase n=1 Tax=Pelagibaculum spongiae TaxID=2080658 RepID=A0A2V1GUK6_9GAMM|nr:glutathione S-transferase [Pelagibaculum spongiae]PVZ66357.1 glutathione S-transferase [Pelagibaculum spongiae]
MSVASQPVLYSFRRCPYAIRARMAIAASKSQVALREVVLKDKPQQLIGKSSKATVPVLIIPASEQHDEMLLDESRDIMRWALSNQDPQQWLSGDDVMNWQWEMQGLLQENDFIFKLSLDRYKYPEQHPQHTVEYYRDQCEVFLGKLEKHLLRNQFLVAGRVTFADIAIFPFIRQCAHVDFEWFQATPYPKLQQWLEHFKSSEIFLSVMQKYPQWKEGDTPVYFPE